VSRKTPVPVHSIQEEHLFILLSTCSCGQAYELVSQALTEIEGQKVDRIQAKCPVCKNEEEFLFDISGFFGDAERYRSLRVNPTSKPSRAIDLEGWTRLALFYMTLAGKAGAERDRIQAEYMAAQCLDEALKLIPAGKEQPPAEAFFSTPDEEARRSLREQESFQKANLLALRERLPGTDLLEKKTRILAGEGDFGNTGESPG
jgi:hypothetical protein